MVMAYMAMAYVVMAYVVMACGKLDFTDWDVIERSAVRLYIVMALYD